VEVGGLFYDAGTRTSGHTGAYVSLAGVKRVAAASLLVLVVALLSVAAWEGCESGDCPPGCHLACRDGCASAPVPAIGTCGRADLLPVWTLAAAHTEQPLSTDPQPEPNPPQA
jgi:hypothetical protein